MKIKTNFILLLMVFLAMATTSFADDTPSIAPSVTYTTSDGETSEDASYSGSAPIKAAFKANPTGTTGWTEYYEWRIYHDSDTEPYIIRYEENTDLEFNQSGLHRIILYAKFTKDGQVIEQNNEDSPLTLTISESFLQMS